MQWQSRGIPLKSFNEKYGDSLTSPKQVERGMKIVKSPICHEIELLLVNQTKLMWFLKRVYQASRWQTTTSILHVNQHFMRLAFKSRLIIRLAALKKLQGNDANLLLLGNLCLPTSGGSSNRSY